MTRGWDFQCPSSTVANQIPGSIRARESSFLWEKIVPARARDESDPSSCRAENSYSVFCFPQFIFLFFLSFFFFSYWWCLFLRHVVSPCPCCFGHNNETKNSQVAFEVVQAPGVRDVQHQALRISRIDGSLFYFVYRTTAWWRPKLSIVQDLGERIYHPSWGRVESIAYTPFF